MRTAIICLPEDITWDVLPAVCSEPGEYIYDVVFVPPAHKLARTFPACECSGPADMLNPIDTFLDILLRACRDNPTAPIVLVGTNQDPAHRVTTECHAQELYDAVRRVKEELFRHGVECMSVCALFFVLKSGMWTREYLS